MKSFNLIISHSVFLLIAFQSIFAVNFIYSLFFGPKSGPNPWGANTLEWQTASPPPHHNFVEQPHVFHGPYEYSHPETEGDMLPQTLKLDKELTVTGH